jgi:hypothetical protein
MYGKRHRPELTVQAHGRIVQTVLAARRVSLLLRGFALKINITETRHARSLCRFAGNQELTHDAARP